MTESLDRTRRTLKPVVAAGVVVAAFAASGLKNNILGGSPDKPATQSRYLPPAETGVDRGANLPPTKVPGTNNTIGQGGAIDPNSIPSLRHAPDHLPGPGLPSDQDPLSPGKLETTRPKAGHSPAEVRIDPLSPDKVETSRPKAGLAPTEPAGQMNNETEPTGVETHTATVAGGQGYTPDMGPQGGLRYPTASSK